MSPASIAASRSTVVWARSFDDLVLPDAGFYVELLSSVGDAVDVVNGHHPPLPKFPNARDEETEQRRAEQQQRREDSLRDGRHPRKRRLPEPQADAGREDQPERDEGWPPEVVAERVNATPEVIRVLCRIARRRCDWPNIVGEQSTTE
jgi:hypothetical protein